MFRYPVKIFRNLRAELAALGLTEEQCSSVMEWVDYLPIHIFGSDTSVVIVDGIVTVKTDDALIE